MFSNASRINAIIQAENALSGDLSNQNYEKKLLKYMFYLLI